MSRYLLDQHSAQCIVVPVLAVIPTESRCVLQISFSHIRIQDRKHMAHNAFKEDGDYTPSELWANTSHLLLTLILSL